MNNNPYPAFAESAALPLSDFLRESGDFIEIVPPVEHESSLLFQAFCNGMPIAFARLKKLEFDQRYEQCVVQLFSARRRPAYCLKLIQVSQNYRNRGIGTVLLREIIHYCRNHNISRLTGEIHGEFVPLQRWYRANGFSIDAGNRLELLIA